jgi:hypothetical protein
MTPRPTTPRPALACDADEARALLAAAGSGEAVDWPVSNRSATLAAGGAASVGARCTARRRSAASASAKKKGATDLPRPLGRRGVGVGNFVFGVEERT